MSALPEPSVFEKHSVRHVACLGCGSVELHPVVNFGVVPLADKLLNENELANEDLRFPLEVVVCKQCSLLQVTVAVDPEILYRDDYPYYTSANPGLVEHFASHARKLIAERSLGSGHSIMEIASNDGHLLKVFKNAGCSVLGIDPARGPAEKAESEGIPTLCDFFSVTLAKKLHEDGKQYDVILGNNALNLVSDIRGFAQGCATLLKPNGCVVLEVPYAVEMVENGIFDTIFHQNLGYFTLSSLESIFKFQNLSVIDAERIPTFGGSIRVVFSKQGNPSKRAKEILDLELGKGVKNLAFYNAFSESIQRKKRILVGMIENLKKEGKHIVAYGAAGGMATTLLCYLNLENGTFDYAVDGNPYKHGRYTSGSRLKIFDPEKIYETKPDAVLLLAWNYAEDIIGGHLAFGKSGGKWILPLPEPRIV